jgi:tungstate transport system substrate-binding protein
MDAYTLTDRGTWANFKNRGTLGIVVQGDKRLFNPYGVLPVDARRFPHVKHADAMRFVDWLTGAPGQQAIAAYRINGEPLFFPDAKYAQR